MDALINLLNMVNEQELNNEEKTNLVSNKTEGTLKKKRIVTSTLHALPHKSSNIVQHLKIIKAYFIATNEGKKPVKYKDFENLGLGFHYIYVSSNNKFLEELGLIETSGTHGMYVPTKYALEFQQYKNWGQEEKALDILRNLVKKSWFSQSAWQILLMREEGAAEKEILNKLGADSKANPEKHMGSLKILLNYLEYVGLVKRDEKTNKIKMSIDLAPQESSTKELITEEPQVTSPQISEPKLNQSSVEEPPITIQQTPTEPIHYREEPGHFTLRVKLDETSIQLLEEEIKYIKGKHALLQKSKKPNEVDN